MLQLPLSVPGQAYTWQNRAPAALRRGGPPASLAGAPCPCTGLSAQTVLVATKKFKCDFGELVRVIGEHFKVDPKDVGRRLAAPQGDFEDGQGPGRGVRQQENKSARRRNDYASRKTSSFAVVYGCSSFKLDLIKSGCISGAAASSACLREGGDGGGRGDGW